MGNKAQAEKRLAALQGGVVLQVRDLNHARSNEVLDFCVEQLKAGKTYNEVRIMLGLLPANVDKKWRAIRECLAEMILPASEEEALLTEASRSGHMIRRMEEFLDKIEERSQAMKGSETEHHFLKLELEAMKQVVEKQQARTDHFLKMKSIQKAEKRKTGTTIIFKNNFRIARPGDVIDVTNGEIGQLQAKLEDGDE